MKVGIVGSRGIRDTDIVEQVLVDSPFIDRDSGLWHNNTFISGGADGVDTSAERIADEYGVDIQIIEPDYSDWSGDEHPAKRRNTRIVERSDAVVAIWNGHSNGTRDTIDKALDRGVSVYVEVIE